MVRGTPEHDVVVRVCVWVCVYAELFPTLVRSMVLGLENEAARVGGIAAPFVVLLGQELHNSSLPFLIFGATAVRLQTHRHAHTHSYTHIRCCTSLSHAYRLQKKERSCAHSRAHMGRAGSLPSVLRHDLLCLHAMCRFWRVC